MNEGTAIDAASEIGVTVTTDRRTPRGVSFKVGEHILFRAKEARRWNIDGGSTTYRRGDAIKLALQLILSAA